MKEVIINEEWDMKKTEALKKTVRSYLDNRYPKNDYIDKYGELENANIGPHGIGFNPVFFKNCIIIEYLDTYDDGDSFFYSDYDSFEELMTAICKEIDVEA